MSELRMSELRMSELRISELRMSNSECRTPNVGTPNVGTPNVGTPNVGTPNVGTPNVVTPNVGGITITFPHFEKIQLYRCSKKRRLRKVRCIVHIGWSSFCICLRLARCPSMISPSLARCVSMISPSLTSNNLNYLCLMFINLHLNSRSL